DLVSGQVQREVEGRDPEDRPDRETPGDPPATPRGRVDVQGDALPDEPVGLLRAETEGEHCAIDLRQGIADRLAGLRGDQPGELFASPADPLADLAQHRGPLEGREPACTLEG